jgi:putative transposase
VAATSLRQQAKSKVAFPLAVQALKMKPQVGRHWSIRQIAAETGVSKSTVHRIWQAFGLQP